MLFHAGIKLFQLSDDNFQGRSNIDVRNMDTADNAFFVDEDECPFRGTVTSKHSIMVCDSAMGPEVRKNLEPEVSHLPGPCIERGDVVDADSKENGIVFVEKLPGDIITRPLV